MPKESTQAEAAARLRGQRRIFGNLEELCFLAVCARRPCPCGIGVEGGKMLQKTRRCSFGERNSGFWLDYSPRLTGVSRE